MATSSRPVKRAFRCHNDQNPALLQGPTLPAAIQTSLLNVGMRIRKSVPEGYKTKAKASAITTTYKPFSVDGSLHCNYSSFSGLLPYCDLLKTGNHQEQPTEVDDLPPLQFDDDDSGFPSSQESVTSNVPSGDRYGALTLLVNSNKRPLEDQELLSPVHPDPLRSHPLGDAGSRQTMGLRPMLQPKTRKARLIDEKVVGNQRDEIMDIDDFEEANFLSFEDDMEYDF